MILVLGFGNALRGDDAAGLLAAEALRPLVPQGVTVRACEGDGTALLDGWAGAAAVILVDAVLSGAPPGTIHRFEARAAPLPAEVEHRSSHTFGAPEAIELARALGLLPPRVLVYGIEGRQFALGAPPSPEVASAAPEAARRILADL